MTSIAEYIDEDMAIAIAMESTGYSYRELVDTPNSVILAHSELKRIIRANKE